MGEHMKKNKVVTRADWILVVVLILLSLVSLFVFFRRGHNDSGLYLSVQVDGKEIDQLDFSSAMEGMSKTYTTEYGVNTVEFHDGKAHIIEADCPDKLCMRQGWVEREGQMLVCLPHHFMVEVRSRKPLEKESGEPDVMVR